MKAVWQAAAHVLRLVLALVTQRSQCPFAGELPNSLARCSNEVQRAGAKAAACPPTSVSSMYSPMLRSLSYCASTCKMGQPTRRPQLASGVEVRSASAERGIREVRAAGAPASASRSHTA